MKKGSYEGFDVVKLGVDWCNNNISAHYPNFRFQYVPISNDLYRKDGVKAEQFIFPYEDNSFDLCVVNSVFTHMLPGEVAHYFSEIKRVLRHGGTCFATFFLFDDKTHFPKGFDFPFDYGHYRLMDKQVKGANVAYEDGYFRVELIEKNEFWLRRLFYGWWRGLPREECKEYPEIQQFNNPTI